MSKAIERAERYYEQLSPHVKNREGGTLVRALLGVINKMKCCDNCRHAACQIDNLPCSQCILNNTLVNWELPND